MIVKVAKRIYRMSRNEYQGLLKIASEQVKFGVYAVEKGDYAELVNEKCASVTKLKELKRLYGQKEFKVYANGR